MRFKTRTHELVVSTYALMVLLLFEHSDTLSYRDIRAATRMPDVDLQRTLQSLACAKYKVLQKEPKGRDVHETDLFSFHADFTCPLARVKIAQIAAKVESPQERKETTAKVEEERKNQVEVRVPVHQRVRACFFIISSRSHLICLGFSLYTGLYCADYEKSENAGTQRPCERGRAPASAAFSAVARADQETH